MEGRRDVPEAPAAPASLPTKEMRLLDPGLRWMLFIASWLVFIAGLQATFVLTEQTDRYFA